MFHPSRDSTAHWECFLLVWCCGLHFVLDFFLLLLCLSEKDTYSNTFSLVCHSLSWIFPTLLLCRSRVGTGCIILKSDWLHCAILCSHFLSGSSYCRWKHRHCKQPYLDERLELTSKTWLELPENPRTRWVDWYQHWKVSNEKEKIAENEDLVPKRKATSVIWKYFSYKKGDIDQTSVLCRLIVHKIAAVQHNIKCYSGHLKKIPVIFISQYMAGLKKKRNISFSISCSPTWHDKVAGIHQWLQKGTVGLWQMYVLYKVAFSEYLMSIPYSKLISLLVALNLECLNR